jgi:hypothetical protein
MENKDRKSVSAKGGFFSELTLNIKLIMRLIADKRVNPLLKLLPIGAVVYLIWPIDLAIGPLDYAALIWLGSYLFIELCPPEIVAEHKAALNQVVPGQWRDPIEGDENVVDAEYWEEK